MKVIIVGGVAGGASCAARLRRLDENAEIIMVERGPYVSYANCGLPYHVGRVIEKESSLLVADEKVFRVMFGIDVRLRCEAIRISPEKNTVELRNVETGEVTRETYDKLVLSPGAAPIRPPLPGIDLPGIFKVRTVPDAREIRAWIEGRAPSPSGLDAYTGFQTVKAATRAVVVGGGFIGLEMAENLIHHELEVTLIQREHQLVTPLDPEMARHVERHLEKNGVRLVLERWSCRLLAGCRRLARGAHSIRPDIPGGHRGPGDRRAPGDWLAKNAGLEIGERGGIRVDEQMRTSAPDIFAVGDAVEVKDYVTGEWSLVALAGPANRQGRIAADVIAGRDSQLPRHAGHFDYRAFRSRRRLDRRQRKDAQAPRRYRLRKDLPLPEFSRRLLSGRQVPGDEGHLPQIGWSPARSAGVGQDGVDKRIDAFAMAIQLDGSVYDLEEAELCYAPQFGSAKAPVNFAGMVAADVLHGDMPLAHWNSVQDEFLLDVRNPAGTGRGERARARSTSRCRNCAPAWANCRATAKSTSSAVRASAPTTPRASCCRTASRPVTSPAACYPRTIISTG